jgi:ribosomal protein S18 acetylase RimI-like enzyme
MALTLQRGRRPGWADNRIQYESISHTLPYTMSVIRFANHRPRAKAVMGKLEAQHPSMRHSEHYTPWHGHITVLTIAPAWRRLGHARRLTESLERVSDINDAWFVDLYVRAGNKVAVGMYRGMGYVLF